MPEVCVVRPLRFRPWRHRRARVLRWLRTAVEHLPERDPARTALDRAVEQVSEAADRYATGEEFLEAMRAAGVDLSGVDFDEGDRW